MILSPSFPLKRTDFQHQDGQRKILVLQISPYFCPSFLVLEISPGFSLSILILEIGPVSVGLYVNVLYLFPVLEMSKTRKSGF